MASRALSKTAGRVALRYSVRHYSAPIDREIPPAKQKYVPSSGTYPKGFLGSGVHVGVKASNTTYDDMALIASEKPCTAAGMFTKNRFQAAPVTVDKQILGENHHRDGIRAIIVNSGCANAVTGTGGIEDALAMSDATMKSLPQSDTAEAQGRNSLVMSTGVIGQRLPISKIVSQIPSAVSALGNSHQHWMSAAKAICTTDTFPKLVSRQFSLPSFPEQTFCIAGMTKGAGMIHPNMGTLLSIVCTDAPIASGALKSALTSAVGSSFNSISIDGDTSTNDTILLLANGAAAPESSASTGVSSISEQKNPADFNAFASELTALCTELAQLVVRDGEGATKFVTIRIRGESDSATCRSIAASIATSSLVKTALYGKDANWGRILCAMGYTPIGDLETAVVPEQVSVSFVPANYNGNPPAGEELQLLVKGEPQKVDEARAAEMLAEEDLEIVVDLNTGTPADRKNEIVYWTCDFSHEYVTINGDYRT